MTSSVFFFFFKKIKVLTPFSDYNNLNHDLGQWLHFSAAQVQHVNYSTRLNYTRVWQKALILFFFYFKKQAPDNHGLLLKGHNTHY